MWSLLLRRGGFYCMGVPTFAMTARIAGVNSLTSSPLYTRGEVSVKANAPNTLAAPTAYPLDFPAGELGVPRLRRAVPGRLQGPGLLVSRSVPLPGLRPDDLPILRMTALNLFWRQHLQQWSDATTGQ